MPLSGSGKEWTAAFDFLRGDNRAPFSRRVRCYNATAAPLADICYFRPSATDTQGHAGALWNSTPADVIRGYVFPPKNRRRHQMEPALIGTMIDAGVDYWRFTYPLIADTCNVWRDVWRRRVDGWLEHGEDEKSFNLHGFQMVGAGEVAYGVFGELMLFQAAGQEADFLLRKTREVIFDGQTTRIDAQVTLIPDARDIQQAAEVRATLRRSEAARQAKRRKTCAVIENRDGSETAYVGSRHSASYGLHYTAGLRHGERYPKQALRWEWRYQKRAADEPQRQFRSAESTGAAAASLIVGQLLRAGFRQEWFTNHVPTWPAPTFHKSSKEGKLKWARTSIKGMVLEAIRDGWGDELADALGVVALERRAEIGSARTFKARERLF